MGNKYINNSELYQLYVDFNNKHRAKYKFLHKLFDCRKELKNKLIDDGCNKLNDKETRLKLIKISKLIKKNCPRLSDDIVLAGYLICEKYVKTGKWYSHNHISDELVTAGIIEIINYGARFDIRLESKNPFSYMTALINNAFIRHINTVKKYNENKHGMMRHSILDGYTISPDGCIYHAIDTAEGKSVLSYMDELDRDLNIDV